MPNAERADASAADPPPLDVPLPPPRERCRRSVGPDAYASLPSIDAMAEPPTLILLPHCVVLLIGGRESYASADMTLEEVPTKSQPAREPRSGSFDAAGAVASSAVPAAPAPMDATGVVVVLASGVLGARARGAEGRGRAASSALLRGAPRNAAAATALGAAPPRRNLPLPPPPRGRKPPPLPPPPPLSRPGDTMVNMAALPLPITSLELSARCLNRCNDKKRCGSTARRANKTAQVLLCVRVGPNVCSGARLRCYVFREARVLSTSVKPPLPLA